MRYRGIPYPIIKNARGYFSSGDDTAQIKANMLTIIMTKPTERIMELNFGTPLDRLDFKKSKDLLAEDAKQMIAAALKIWEKRIQVTSVSVKFVPENDIHIQVSFIDPVNLQQEQMLTLQLPLRGEYYG